MSPSDLIDDLRSRINPAYANQIGTESYERRLCVEALEALMAERDELLAALEKAIEFVPAGYGIERQCWSAIDRAKSRAGEVAS